MPDLVIKAVDSGGSPRDIRVDQENVGSKYVLGTAAWVYTTGGNWIRARANTNGDAHAVLYDSSGSEVGTAANPLAVQGADAEDAAASDNPLLAGGRYDATARTLDDGDAGAVAIDAAGRMHIVGAAAENAAATGNPVQVGGRYDSSDRTLGDGDVGALALTSAGHAKVNLTGRSVVEDVVVNANEVRDTNSRTSSESDNRDYTRRTIFVANGLNESVDVQIRATRNSGSNYANIGSAITVPANTDYSIDTSDISELNDPYPFMVARYTANVSPASGSISIYFEKQP